MSNLAKPLPTASEYAELVLHFRKMKHDINNTLAVMMALAEMSQRKADHVPKLINEVLDKSTKTADELRAFQTKLNALLPDDPT